MIILREVLVVEDPGWSNVHVIYHLMHGLQDHILLQGNWLVDVMPELVLWKLPFHEFTINHGNLGRSMKRVLHHSSLS